VLARICVLIALSAAVCAPASGQVSDETEVPRIPVAALKKAADAGQVLILDVRDASSYAEGHIPGAINTPLDELQQKLATLRAAKQAIVTYCG
jgi:rhodanese-related sulfurtransferase